MRDEVLRFGLVGAGGIAGAYVQAFKGLTTAKLIAIADARPDAARELAVQAGCHSCDSYKSLAQEWDLDAVIICTPPSTHAEIALHFIESKIHVLCEKPLSIDSKSAELMLSAAKKAGVRMTMASKFRYVEDVIKAKSIVRSGILGEILLVENSFSSKVDMSKRWNSNPGISGGGVIIDNGTHSVDIMRYFLGPLEEIQVIEGKRSAGLVVEESAQIFVKSRTGVLGRIDLSWGINKEQESYLNIYGSQGTVSVGWKASKYKQAGSKDWIVFGHGYEKVQAFRSQIENFCMSIWGEEALLITPADAMASVEVIEAAYIALEQSRWISVNKELFEEQEPERIEAA